jgi:hypothetical protein
MLKLRVRPDYIGPHHAPPVPYNMYQIKSEQSAQHHTAKLSQAALIMIKGIFDRPSLAGRAMISVC